MNALSTEAQLAVLKALEQVNAAIDSLTTWTGGMDEEGYDLGTEVKLADVLAAIDQVKRKYTRS